MMNLPFSDSCAVFSKLPQREYSHIKRTGPLFLHVIEVKKAVLVHLRLFNLKRFSFWSFCGAG